MDSAALLVTAVVLALAVAIGSAAVRIVPAGHLGVVTRAGRVARSKPSGLLVVMPAAERVAMVPLNPRAIDPLSVTSLSRDGVEVRLVVSVLWRVTDPVLAVQAVPDARTCVADVVERALHHLAASVDLADLLRDRESLLSRLPATVLPLITLHGAELVDLALLDAEVRVGPELLRLLA
jgi:regulator of protease activity HflC (stomatin/prohibitin superfamily)